MKLVYDVQDLETLEVRTGLSIDYANFNALRASVLRWWHHPQKMREKLLKFRFALGDECFFLYDIESKNLTIRFRNVVVFDGVYRLDNFLVNIKDDDPFPTGADFDDEMFCGFDESKYPPIFDGVSADED